MQKTISGLTDSDSDCTTDGSVGENFAHKLTLINELVSLTKTIHYLRQLGQSFIFFLNYNFGNDKKRQMRSLKGRLCLLRVLLICLLRSAQG